jgi:hypothetical protein
MKLPLILAAVVALGGIASADGPRGQQGARGPLRQALLRRFDHNHDGHLGPRERRQAVRALRKLERQLARNDGRGARRGQRLIQKYDLNGDGNVGPGEMPPAMARRLRPLDRDGDGWLDGDELYGPRE